MVSGCTPVFDRGTTVARHAPAFRPLERVMVYSCITRVRDTPAYITASCPTPRAPEPRCQAIPWPARSPRLSPEPPSSQSSVIPVVSDVPVSPDSALTTRIARANTGDCQARDGRRRAVHHHPRWELRTGAWKSPRPNKSANARRISGPRKWTRLSRGSCGRSARV